MENEKSIFKFKRAEVKLIGEFNLLSNDEYDLLIRRGFIDEVNFIHIRKLWNIIETTDQLDEDGNITTPGNKPQPVYQIVTGFMKDNKFIITNTYTYSDRTFTGIYSKYRNILISFLDDGWIKDKSNYIDDKPIKPAYFKNEKSVGFSLEDYIKNSEPIPQVQAMPSQASKAVAPKNVLHKILRNIKIK